MAINTKKIIIIRFDAGDVHGIGHAIRSLKIAKELNNGNNVILSCNLKTKKLFNLKNFKTIFKKKHESESAFMIRSTKNFHKATIIIDKLYSYSSNIIKKITKNYNKVIFIQNHNSKINSDNTVILPSEHNLKSEVSKLKKKTKKVFFGKKYIIVNKKEKKLKEKKKYLAINFGGSDPKKITYKIVQMLNKIKFKYKTEVLLGLDNKQKDSISKINKLSNIKIKEFNKKILYNATMAITSFGITAYELIHNNVFSLHISHSKKHSIGAKILENKFKISKDLGDHKNLKVKEFEKKIYFYWNYLTKNNTKIKFNRLKLSENSLKNNIRIILNAQKK